MITIRVEGHPQPQAGTRSVPTAQGNRQISTGGKDLQLWRNQVTAAAIAAKHTHGLRQPLHGPVALTIRFRLPMPATRPATTRRAGQDWCTVKPDLDKLTRAVGDSPTAAKIINDDAQIVRLDVTKIEHRDGWHGATIHLANAGDIENLT